MSESNNWQPLTLEQLKSLFEKSEKPYWLSGGWAIDLFVGRQTRAHEDLDISISRSDQFYFQNYLNNWDLHYADPARPGVLLPWHTGATLFDPIYNVWGRKSAGGPWNLQLLICDFSDTEWIYRRKQEIRGPLKEFDWTTKDGMKVLSPIIQLLFKSRSPRPKDEHDFQHCLAVFSTQERRRLRELILEDSGANHPWLDLINRGDKIFTQG